MLGKPAWFRNLVGAGPVVSIETEMCGECVMAKIDPKLERLKASDTFAKLSDRKLKDLAPYTDDLQVPAGTTLMDEGSFPHELEVIVEGTADIIIGGNKVGEVGPGTILGEMALLEHGRRTAKVVTTSDTKLIVMSARAFSALLDKFPEIAEDIRAMAAARAEENAKLND